MPPKAAAKMSSTKTVVPDEIIPASEIRGRIKAFLAAVSDPRKPSCCAWCFAVLVFGTLKKEEHVRALQMKGHAFLEGCFCLLIVLSELPVPPIRRTLEDNARRCPDKKLHKHRLHGDLNDPFDILMETLFLVLDLGLVYGENPVLRKSGGQERGRQCFHRRNGFWPVAVKQIFPLGVQRTVGALVHWACAPFSRRPVRALGIHLEIAYPVVLPALLEPPVRDRVAWLTVQCLTPGPEVPWPGAPPFALPCGLRVSLAARRDFALLDEIAYVLRALHGGPLSRADDAQRVFAGHEVTLRAALWDVVINDYDEDSRAAVIDRTFADYMCLLDTVLGDEADECAHGFEVVPRMLTVLRVLERATEGGWCAGPGCGKNEISADGVRRFARCGLCQAVRYCSTDCQLNDTKQGNPSHKQVCPILTAMRERGVETGGRLAASEASLAEMAFDEKDMDVLYRWALGRNLVYQGRHIRNSLPAADKYIAEE